MGDIKVHVPSTEGDDEVRMSVWHQMYTLNGYSASKVDEKLDAGLLLCESHLMRNICVPFYT